MAQTLTKESARNIFYGGIIFFILLFLALTFNTLMELPNRDRREKLDTSTRLGQKIALGKTLWEKNDCIGCHTLLGEGAYFASELGNVYKRHYNSKDAIKDFIQSQPVKGIPGHRSMPQYHFSEEQLDALAEFLRYSSEIDTANWPPTKEG